jgi:hypothetical protein
MLIVVIKITLVRATFQSDAQLVVVQLIVMEPFQVLYMCAIWCHNTERSDTQHNNIQHNDTQQNIIKTVLFGNKVYKHW